MEEQKFKKFVETLKLEETHDGKELKKLITDTVAEHLENVNELDILFSGGVDSTTLAFLAKRLGKKFTVISAGTKGSPDLMWAQGAAEELGFKIEIAEFTKEDVKRELPKIMEIVKTNNPVTISIAIPFYFALKLSKNKYVMSGLGSEELYAGYKRHELSENINEECLKGLKQVWERDLERDLAIMNYYGKTIIVPLLDEKLIEYSLNIHPELKIKDSYKKWILRDVAQKLGVPKKFAWRGKKAAQYGSGAMKLLKKMAKEEKKTVTEFLAKMQPAG